MRWRPYCGGGGTGGTAGHCLCSTGWAAAHFSLYASILPITAVAALLGSSRLMITGADQCALARAQCRPGAADVAGSPEYLRPALVLTLPSWGHPARGVGAAPGCRHAFHLADGVARLPPAGGAAGLHCTPHRPGRQEAGAAGDCGDPCSWARSAPAVAAGGAALVAASTGFAVGTGCGHVAGGPRVWQWGWQLIRWRRRPRPGPAGLAPAAVAGPAAPGHAGAGAHALVALGQSIAIAKTLAARTGQAFDVNRECLGQGLPMSRGLQLGAGQLWLAQSLGTSRPARARRWRL